ncbi:hypothetical protein D3C81_08040 [compost metagenome]
MKTTLKNLKGIEDLIKRYNMPSSVDLSCVHDTMKPYIQQLSDMPCVNIKNMRDVVEIYSTIYRGNFVDILPISNVENIKMTYNEKNFNMRNIEDVDNLLTFSVENEKELKEFLNGLTDLNLSNYKLSRYKDALFYQYRMHCNTFYTTHKDSWCNIKIVDGRINIQYRDFTKYNMLNKDQEIADFQSSSGGTAMLLESYPTIFEDLDLQYIEGDISTISFKHDWDKSLKEEYSITLSPLLVPNIVCFIDSLFFRLGARDFKYKYLFEEILMNISYHNYKLKSVIEIEIGKDLLPIFGGK